MILNAQWQSTATATVDQGSSVNAGITVSPETAEIASARTSTESVFSCEFVGKSGNVVTVKMTNESALDGNTYQIAATLVDIYGNEVTTSNTKGFMGGITG